MTYARMAIFAGILLLLLAGGLGLKSCIDSRNRAAQERVEDAQTGAAMNSAQDAINTQGAAAEREKASEDLTRTNEKEIRDAQGAGDAVNPAVRDAGLRALCRRPSYRNNERCRLLNAPATGVAQRR